MNRDDIIRMAQEAGFSAYHLAVLDQGIYRFANLVAAAEREACAEACERAVGSASMYQDVDAANSAYRIKNYCQKLIRERGGRND